MDNIRQSLINKIKSLKNNEIEKKKSNNISQSSGEDSRLDDIIFDIENLFDNHFISQNLKINGKIICKYFFTTHSLLIPPGSGKESKAKNVKGVKSSDKDFEVEFESVTANSIKGFFKGVRDMEGKLINKFIPVGLSASENVLPDGDPIDDNYFNFTNKIDGGNNLNTNYVRFFNTDISNYLINSSEITGDIKLNNIISNELSIPDISWQDFNIYNLDIYVGNFSDSQYQTNFKNIPKIKNLFTNDKLNVNHFPIVDNNFKTLIDKYNFKNIYETSTKIDLENLLFNQLKKSDLIQGNVKSLLNGDNSGNFNDNYFVLSDDWEKLQQGYISDDRIKIYHENLNIPLDAIKLNEFTYKKEFNDNNKYIGIIANDLKNVNKNFTYETDLVLSCKIKAYINNDIIILQENIDHDIELFYISFKNQFYMVKVNESNSKSFKLNYNYNLEGECLIINYKIKKTLKVNLDNVLMFYLHKLNNLCLLNNNVRNDQLDKLKILIKRKIDLKEKFTNLNKRINKLENKLLDIHNG